MLLFRPPAPILKPQPIRHCKREKTNAAFALELGGNPSPTKATLQKAQTFPPSPSKKRKKEERTPTPKSAPFRLQPEVGPPDQMSRANFGATGRQPGAELLWQEPHEGRQPPGLQLEAAAPRPPARFRFDASLDRLDPGGFLLCMDEIRFAPL